MFRTKSYEDRKPKESTETRPSSGRRSRRDESSGHSRHRRFLTSDENIAVTFENIIGVVGDDDTKLYTAKSVRTMVNSLYVWLTHDSNSQITLPCTQEDSEPMKMWPNGATVNTRDRTVEPHKRPLNTAIDDETASNISSSVTGAVPVPPPRPLRGFSAYQSQSRKYEDMVVLANQLATLKAINEDDGDDDIVVGYDVAEQHALPPRQWLQPEPPQQTVPQRTTQRTAQRVMQQREVATSTNPFVRPPPVVSTPVVPVPVDTSDASEIIHRPRGIRTRKATNAGTVSRNAAHRMSNVNEGVPVNIIS